MESLMILEYQFRTGVLTIEELADLVKQEKITQEDFFSITRKNYRGFRKIQELDSEKTEG